MAGNEVYVGQRRSYGGALCTVRYHGPLSNTKGEWLGIEWDDPSRGKHNGQHEGQQIFQCLSSSPTAASFVRPSRNPDPERTLLEAVRFKYAPVNKMGGDAFTSHIQDEVIEISGKVVEEVGFERIQKQLSVLADLKIVLVDELVVSGVAGRGASTQHIRDAQLELERTCPNIVELDVGWNVIETWQDVVDMCVPFRKLKILKAGGLRLRDFGADCFQEPHPFQNVEELHLNECLLTPAQIISILFPKGKCAFPSLKRLSLSLNELESFEINDATGTSQCPTLTTLILDGNRYVDLSHVPVLLTLFPNLKTLSFQGNIISRLGLDAHASTGSSGIPNLETLNLANNRIRDYAFVNSLPQVFPNLASLRISRNPLYEPSGPSDESSEPSSGSRQQQQVQSRNSDSTSYYLTLARIPNLKSLNYTTITPRDREEGEIYYLSVAEKELRPFLQGNTAQKPLSGEEVSETPSSLSPQEVVELARKTYPLYSSLCEKYDREDILVQYVQQQRSAAHLSSDSSQTKSELDAYAPGTLGSRLVDAHFFYMPPTDNVTTTPPREPFHRLLPTTISVYRLKSLLARYFGLPPLRFRLVYESHEYDPVEPITSTRNPAAGTGNGQDLWESWGDWDVDRDEVDGGGGGVGDDDHDDDDDVVGAKEVDIATTATMPMYITRQGNRFKKRETEVLDGMRPWGDFLDVDDGPVPSHGHGHDWHPGTAHLGSTGRRRREVRVRVEPH
ncbi:hypothetical protein Z517_01129 [Fonsecaea pedrosoi CBS 271.37]|uniref:CAP-Gly domain-containing protein n=1 Tax=Fonsecaea pedrosoi CBS 271.37 TaxID=1442368 RepID=A0A0D2FG99_9EURO|nr:uncharacterized protein Z517_01129 [Fonsecaea pedrosoi CBS 271.37]KIW85737.1 hypothetical protein Z517_01129 [Fonsecaea pedrosoi CBS 271.37]